VAEVQRPAGLDDRPVLLAGETEEGHRRSAPRQGQTGARASAHPKSLVIPCGASRGNPSVTKEKHPPSQASPARTAGEAAAMLYWRTAPGTASQEGRMSEQPQPNSPSRAEVEASLDEVRGLLREAHHLGPEAQETLAGLVDELSRALATGTMSAEE